METQSKHTATPWKVDNKLKQYVVADEVVGVRVGYPILSCCTENEETNAEFIVRAVNSHEALVEACNDALELLGGCQCERPKYQQRHNEKCIACKIEEALKLAREL